RIPRAKVVEMTAWIKSWARTPGKTPPEVLGKWEWIGPWWERANWLQFKVPLFLFLVVLPWAIAVRFLRPREQRRPAWPCLLLPPTLAAAAGWFASAPDIRFAGPVFWVLFGGAVVLVAYESKGSAPGWRWRCLTLAGHVAVLLLAAFVLAAPKKEEYRNLFV